jgi:hypothetical protein
MKTPPKKNSFKFWKKEKPQSINNTLNHINFSESLNLIYDGKRRQNEEFMIKVDRQYSKT